MRWTWTCVCTSRPRRPSPCWRRLSARRATSPGAAPPWRTHSTSRSLQTPSCLTAAGTFAAVVSHDRGQGHNTFSRCLVKTGPRPRCFQVSFLKGSRIQFELSLTTLSSVYIDKMKSNSDSWNKKPWFSRFEQKQSLWWRDLFLSLIFGSHRSSGRHQTPTKLTEQTHTCGQFVSCFTWWSFDRYRRSYDSDFVAPLVNHHVWPCLMQGVRVLVKGEAHTRRGASLVSVPHCPDLATPLKDIDLHLGNLSDSRRCSGSLRTCVFHSLFSVADHPEE